jgi:acyl-homoserine-lactone acylase
MVRRVRGGVVFVLALLCSGCASGGMAKAGGAAGASGSLPSTPAGAAEILWDRWGVPHIYAGDAESVAYGFGWAQAHSHGNAILQLYGLARGRAAEYWGEEYLASDRFVRSMGLARGGDAAYMAQSPAFRTFLDAFAAGVNAYAAAHPEALDAEMRRVLPVTPSDVLAHALRLTFAFAALTGNQPMLIGLDGMPRDATPASNTWAIGPERTASGNAMLLQNPHLSWTTPFMRFYEAQLVTPEVNVYGATLLGLPVPAIAFNESLGWSHTVNLVDVLDTYRLVLEDGGYRFDGEVRAFESHAEVLRVRLSDGSFRNEALEVRRSVHGPVLTVSDTLVLAVRTPVLERFGALEQWWEMAHANDLEEFENALRRLQLGMFTVSYADRDGRIFYLFNGTVPRRGHGDFGFWQRAVRGDTSATLWSGIHPYEALPRVVDPPGGFVQNANSPPWFATYPAALDPGAFPAYFAPDYLLMREKQSLELMLGAGDLTLDALVEMRHSTGVLLAERVLDELLATASNGNGAVEDAAAVLAEWDRRVEPGSRGAALFLMWAQEQCRGPATNPCAFAQPWSRDDPLARNARLADPAASLAALERAVTATRQRFGALNVPWGEVMRIAPDLAGRGGPGDPLGIFQVVSYAPGSQGFRAVHGDSWVAAIEFTPRGPRGKVLMSYGNATQPGSPHDGDQLPLLARGEMRPLWFTREEVERNLRERVRLER